MDDCFIKPREPTAEAAITEIANELALFDDWTDRYHYLIEMGRDLPPFPAEWQNDARRVPGCQSQVWLQEQARDGLLYFAGASDAAIVSGLVALLLRVYSGRSSVEIAATSPDFLHQLGLVKALSTNRGNGVEAMAKAIRRVAAA